MSRSFLIAITFLLLCGSACMAAGNYGEQWKKGNAFYGQKQYDSAAYYYEQLAAGRPRNTELYYNLGNAYYRLNKVSLAVLNYERALQANPDNADAKDNLAVTQNRISNHILPASDIFFISWWSSITSPAHATGWAMAALVVFVLIIASLWARRFSGSGARIPVQVPGVLGFICACLLIPAFVAAANSQKTSGAVVMEPDAPLMNDQQKGKPLVLVPEGTTVKLLGDKGMWVEVALPDGRKGWLLENQVTKI